MFENSRSKFWQNIDISPVVGAVLNNKAAYYTYADYNKVSWVNLGVGITKELELSNEITMPIALNYTHNAAAQNTGLFGQNFWVATLSLSY
jgi:hypothetical protein